MFAANLHRISRLLSVRRMISSPPLLLSMNQGANEYGSDNDGPRIRFPTHPLPTIVSSVDDILKAVDMHYDLDSNTSFVGGMGETDSGVWFVPPINNPRRDPLYHWDELLKPSIEQIFTFRHGVPIGVYTSGIFPVNMDELKILTAVNVSLLAGNPSDYGQAAELENRGDKDQFFRQVCNFLVSAQDEGIPIHVEIFKPYASEGRDLALALGAQQVNIWEEP
jgi:hypothetical protein